MEHDQTTIASSRRALLAAALGAVAASVAGALGRPVITRAADGDVVRVGQSFAGTQPTKITSTRSDAIVGVAATEPQPPSQYETGEPPPERFAGVMGENTKLGFGVYGLAFTGTGVFGHSGSVAGVHGDSSRAIGVVATNRIFDLHGDENRPALKATTEGTQRFGILRANTAVAGFSRANPTEVMPRTPVSTGIFGYSNDASQGEISPDPPRGVLGQTGVGRGVEGLSASGVGVYGTSGAPPAGSTATKSGVYGWANQDATARAVVGETRLGKGVHGISESGEGVRGQATTGAGIRARATSGTAALFEADTNGTALRTTRGHVRFSTSGLATILAGTNSVRVAPGFDISSTSKVLAVLQGNPGGSVVLRYVLRDDPNNRFTIQLSANAAVNTPVAWFVIS
jgi:hypothetical protein